jgi:thiol:disulfide interchange protein DsbG
MKNIFFAIAAVAAFMMGSATAQSTPKAAVPPNLQQIPAPLLLAVQGGMKIENKFEAAGGMTGWILSQGLGRNIVAFTPPNGEFVMVGMMRNAKGEDLTKGYLERYAPRPDYDKYWSRLEKMETINEGAKGSDVKTVIFAFMDPNCVFCHFAHKALQHYAKVGLQIRWVPVAILGGDSAGKAAALMTAKDPLAAWEDHGRNWNPQTHKGGVAPLASVSLQVRKSLDDNVALMAELGINGTPGILYKDAQGRVQKTDGMPNLNDLPSITGLPEQPIPEPELQRFRR